MILNRPNDSIRLHRIGSNLTVTCVSVHVLYVYVAKVGSSLPPHTTHARARRRNNARCDRSSSNRQATTRLKSSTVVWGERELLGKVVPNHVIQSLTNISSTQQRKKHVHITNSKRRMLSPLCFVDLYRSCLSCLAVVVYTDNIYSSSIILQAWMCTMVLIPCSLNVK